MLQLSPLRPSLIEIELAAQDALNDRGVERPLGLLDALVQLRFALARHDLDLLLRQDRPVVQRGRGDVDSAAGHLDPSRQRGRDTIVALEVR